MEQPAGDNYVVRLPVFEGPLDLLLHLIEREELDITRVALAQVTDQYLAYLRAMTQQPLEALADFLVMAARLIQIKSQALLPRPPALSPEEEDPGDRLARLLLEYKRFKQAAQALRAREERGVHMHLRLAPPPPLPARLDMTGITLDRLMDVVRDALAALPPQMPGHLVPQPRVSIRELMISIAEQLARAGELTFREVLSAATSRAEIIATLLAVLELSRRRRIRLEQPTPFGEIVIVPEDPAARVEVAEGDDLYGEET
jgi:segregation and condensation protein A